MEDILEFLLELVLEGGEELCRSRRVSKWIRYPIMILMSLMFVGVIFLMFYISWISWKENALFSIVMAAFGIILIVALVFKIRKEYLKYNG